jgi:TrmH family RNA methyltransferase
VTRVKRSVHAKKKRRAVLEQTKGFRGEAHSNYKRAKEALLKADAYAYRDRRNRKRDFRRLWITRINAAARQNGMSYSTFSPRGVGCLASTRQRRAPRASFLKRTAPFFVPDPDAPKDERPATRTELNLNDEPMTITSQQNPHLKQLRRLARKAERERSGRFAAEGEDLVAAAAAAGWRALEGYRLAGSGLGGEDFVDVDAQALAAVSMLGSSTRVIGVYEQRWRAPVGPLAVALWGVGDPGNVGTIIRAAHAFGASCVALGPRCADPYGPKATRASMGAIFAVGAIARFDSLAQLPGRVVGLDAVAERPLRGPLTGETTLVVGGERDGLPEQVLAACDEVRSIRQLAGDSLNAAMAATVALYEATRDGTAPTAANRMADG